MPGIVEELARDESTLLFGSPPANMAFAPTNALFLERSEEDLQNAAILQSVVRAYIMRKNKLKEENTPFAELMLARPLLATGLEEVNLLIPHVPNFKQQSQLQQQHSQTYLQNQHSHSQLQQPPAQPQSQPQQPEQIKHTKPIFSPVKYALQRQSSKYTLPSTPRGGEGSSASGAKPPLAATFKQAPQPISNASDG